MEQIPRRIDKGIARGPRRKPGPKPSSPRHNNGQFLPVLPNSPEDIAKALKDYSNGATLQQLAQQYGVTRQSVYSWLLGELGGPEHASLVTRALTARIAKADELIEVADNPTDVMRGRELARNYRLDLERRRSSLYGAKQEVSFQVTIPTSNVLSDASALLELIKEHRAEKTIEALPIDQAEKQEGGVGSLSTEQPPLEKE